MQNMGRASRQAAYVDTGLVTATANEATLAGAWSVEALTTSMTNANNHAIVALDGDDTIGYCSGRCRNPLDEGQVRLYRIYLHPNYWGQQVGYTMWQSYYAALTKAVKRIDVGVFAGSTRAKKFYQRLGFRIVSTKDGTHQLQMQLD